MSKTAFIDYKRKQDLLYSKKTDSAQLKRQAELCIEAGAFSDGIEMLHKANATDELRNLIGELIKQGDTFLFRKVCGFIRHEASSTEWDELAKNAAAVGKLQFALQAYEEAGNEAMVEKMQSEIAEAMPNPNETNLIELPENHEQE